MWVSEIDREWKRERVRDAISESVFIDYSQFCQPCLTAGVQLYEDKVFFVEWVTLILTWHIHTRTHCRHTYTLLIKQALVEWDPQLNFSFIPALSLSYAVLWNALTPQGFLCISVCKLDHLRDFFFWPPQSKRTNFGLPTAAPLAVI